MRSTKFVDPHSGNGKGVIAKPCVTGGHGWVQKGQALSSDIKMNCLCAITGAKVVLTGGGGAPKTSVFEYFLGRAITYK
jgi:hypothetical protein